ncbi:YncE family protein [Pontibacter liquoris]|uniref:YncE family protein n=1 Tax=Pontibacter liquoris TaxID=2905677 RepID=UPI001FA7D88F|nr:YncE family protein [Pontibacter liquoris]
MKKINLFRRYFVAASLALSTLAFTGCDNTSDAPVGSYAADGVFVVNEGNFGAANGSISFYNTATKTVQNDIFGKENSGQLLGDVLQSMALYNDKAFIVANNSNKVAVVNVNTFKAEGTIEGLQAPRYFVAATNDKGYVTEWLGYDPVTWQYGNGRVSVIDLKTNTVTKTIEVGVQPEQLVLHGGKLYVANSGGTTISVINTTTDAVEATLPVATGPTNLVLDRNNSLWVLSSGVKYTSNNTAGALSKIDLGSGAVTASFPFDDKEALPEDLTLNGSKDKLYYSYKGNVYQQEIGASARNTTPFIAQSFYGLGVDPETGYIYGADSKGFTADGTVSVFQPDGRKAGEFQAGIGPNGFVFR